MTDGDTVTLTLKFLPDDGTPPAVRLRMLLKSALRRHRMRCVSCFDKPPAGTPQAPLGERKEQREGKGS